MGYFPFFMDIEGKKGIVVGVFKGEIREYELVNKHVVKVRNAVTRNGETAKEFFVDLRTHEIIDPEEEE